MSCRRRIAGVAASLALTAAVLGVAPARAAPPRPDLSSATPVPVESFLQPDDVGNARVYFRTPTGLQCGIVFLTAGCSGVIPARPDEVNQIAIGNGSGLWNTANPLYVSDTAPTLDVGQKVALGDIECAVGPDATTSCAKGDADGSWLVVSPTYSGIGPTVQGLPAGFPDPDDFIRGDDDFIVGSGAKNISPIFTVGADLTCKILDWSGVEIGCNGPLPGVSGGENEVSLSVPAPTGQGVTVRRTDEPRFATPAYPGEIRRLPVGHRVDDRCLALPDGVACLVVTEGRFETGFVVDADGVTGY